MSSSQNETVVELFIIITCWCHVKNKSQRMGVDSKGMRPETLAVHSPMQMQWLKRNTFQSVQCLPSSKGLQV